MQKKKLAFYFDFLSPYSYLAWCELGEILKKHEIELVLKPVVFGVLLDHFGQLGPMEIPPKREQVHKECLRYSRLHGISFQFPKFHPFKPLLALRLALREVSGELQMQVTDVLWRAIWTQGMDGASEEFLGEALTQAGLPADSLIEKAKTQEAKEGLRRETQAAIAHGIFGIPTFVYLGERFWGKDQLRYLSLSLEGKDPVTSEEIQESLKTPPGAQRVLKG